MKNDADEQTLMARIVAIIATAWKEEKKPDHVSKAINVASRLDNGGFLKRPENAHRELLKKVLLHTDAPDLSAFSAEECAELNALVKEAIREVPKVKTPRIIAAHEAVLKNLPHVDPAFLEKIKKH